MRELPWLPRISAQSSSLRVFMNWVQGQILINPLCMSVNKDRAHVRAHRWPESGVSRYASVKSHRAMPESQRRGPAPVRFENVPLGGFGQHDFLRRRSPKGDPSTSNLPPPPIRLEIRAQSYVHRIAVQVRPLPWCDS